MTRFSLFATVLALVLTVSCSVQDEGTETDVIGKNDTTSAEVTNEFAENDTTETTCEFKDCNGDCANEEALGNGFCSEKFRCAALNWDEGDCCPDGFVRDCRGDCANERLLGDGDCDWDEFDEFPSMAHFACEEYNWDNGDCCPPNETKDCNNQCWPYEWSVDDICDDGSHLHMPNWNCEKFRWDSGACIFCGDGVCADDNFTHGESELTCPQDCPSKCGDHFCNWIESLNWVGEEDGHHCADDCELFEPSDQECPEGKVVDCNGTCQPSSRLGDDACDHGYYAVSPDFQCWRLNWDNGDCDRCGDNVCYYFDEDHESCPEDCPVRPYIP
ncbi:MAG: hypothetical protein UT32_C0015G0001 [Parcubacteria group bacterium GW2011_GWC2_39_14]|nr:MAG: hypothetical protein UT32_C0015G0001 [Parcubacteria group bacterium GW2011_GWC2_39_14]KKR54397.1 MAG: hypothetical protein UT91_C0016G0001 [Parcubacteria group bacterium GW2011_GWA2_40_23]